MPAEVGEVAPDFTLPSVSEGDISLSQYRGQKHVVFPYPELSDWHPKGKVTQSYDLWNEERGVAFRAVLVVDKAGIVRFRQRYTPGTLPDAEEILKVVEGLE